MICILSLQNNRTAIFQPTDFCFLYSIKYNPTRSPIDYILDALALCVDFFQVLKPASHSFQVTFLFLNVFRAGKTYLIKA